MFLYHYRPIHAAFEWLLKAATPRRRTASGGALSTPARILMVKFGGLGEAVLARSLAEHLRRHSGTMIDVLVDSRTREVMSCGSDARVFFYNPGSHGIATALRILREVRAQRYEAAVDFEQTSLLTAAFLRASGIPVRVGFAPPGDNPRARFFTHPVELRETDSMWSGVVRVGRVLDASLPEQLCVLPIPCGGEAERFVDGWWRANVACNDIRPRVVAMHVGVGPRAQYRRWPLGRFVELAETIRHTDPNLVVILTGNHGERPLIEQFRSLYPGRVVDARALSSAERTAIVLSRCDLLVANDTGVMHLGAAMGTPTVGVFGASNPAYWAPVGARATYVYKTRMPCSPCIDSYRRIIPRECVAADKTRCMLAVDVNDVLRAASKVAIAGWLDASKSPRELEAFAG